MNQKPVRILHLIEHLVIGGAERVLVDIVANIDKDKFNSIVCVYQNENPLRDELVRAGYSVIYLRKSLLTPLFPKFLKPLFLLIESIIFVIRLAKLMRDKNIRILHTHLFSAGLWGRLASLLGGRPKIITTEHTTADWAKSLKKRVFNRLLNPITDRIVAVTDTVGKTVVDVQKVVPGQVIIIPNGIKIDSFSASKNSKHKTILPGSKPRIAIISSLTPVKRHDLLFKALKVCFKQIPTISCCVIGDGPERAGLEQMVRDLDISNFVFFLGNRNDVNELLRDVEIVVSTSDYEGLPMNLLEAMAAGVPVVATDAGGNKDLVDSGKTGILVERGNVDAIANGICKIIGNHDLSEKLRLNGFKTVEENYSLDEIIKKWEKLYTSLLFP